MSEILPGLPAFELSPTEPVPAAAVVLYRRRSGGGVDVFWVKRGKKTRFAAGYYAFLGGRVDPEDSSIPVRGASGFEAAIRVTACRETFEEAGVLLARGAEKLPAARLNDLRRSLLDEERKFADIVAAEGLAIVADDFTDAGRWITPPFLPMRYDARLFLTESPPAQIAEVLPARGELAEGGFIHPDAALTRWREGTALLHPPNLNALRLLSRFTTAESVLEGLRNPAHCPDHIARRIEFQQGVRLFPMRTPTLPPATHTNCLVLGNRELLVVDPGSPDAGEQRRLIDYLEAYRGEGFTLSAVVLTHRHQDHIGAAGAIATHFNVPIWAHEWTAAAIPFAVDRKLADGDEIHLFGEPAMNWRVVHTPGHARGHVCLLEQATRTLVAGDMVSGVSTIVIDPPEGDMAVYLASLEKLLNLQPAVIYPAHGPAILDGPSKLREYIAHRREREELILRAMGDGAHTLSAIVEKAYSDTHPLMHPVAERSALATLVKLANQGRVRESQGVYQLV